MIVAVDHDFDRWRQLARHFIDAGVSPEKIHWVDVKDGPTLFEEPLAPQTAGTRSQSQIPREALYQMRTVACHRHGERWNVLYRIAWRMIAEQDRTLLSDAADPDVRQFDTLRRQVRFDAHKAKAFIRFRRLTTPEGDERFVAWHRPAHRVIPLVARFFANRFCTMHWIIFTPDCSAEWDREVLRLGAGAATDPFAERDQLEDLWLTYYASIFNPARVKIRAMLKEMPKRYWETLPETALIDDLLRNAPQRTRHMMLDADASPE
jgi:probable DNA metabolism protein